MVFVVQNFKQFSDYLHFFSPIVNNDDNSKKCKDYKWKIFLFISKVHGFFQNLNWKSMVAIVELPIDHLISFSIF